MRKLLAWVSLALVLSSCAQLLKNARRDFDSADNDFEDSPGSDFGPVAMKSPVNRSPATPPAPSEGPVANGTVATSAPDQNPTYEAAPERPTLSAANRPIYLPPVQRQYKNGSRATSDDFIDQSQEEGSLWASSGQTNYYFTKNRVRSPGDLISLVIESDLFRDIGLESKRTLNLKERASELNFAQSTLRAKFLADRALKKDEITTSAAAPEIAPVKTVPSPSPTPANLDADAGSKRTDLAPEDLEKLVPRATPDDVDMAKSMDVKVGDSIMGEIVERYPNGNYKIRLVKRVTYKYGPPRLVSVLGIVKGSDINEETDVIRSGRLFEYRVAVAH